MQALPPATSSRSVRSHAWHQPGVCAELIAEGFCFLRAWPHADDPLAGAAGTRFGRNVPLAAAHPDTDNLLHPNPMLVSTRLLHRSPAQPAEHPRVPFLNMWAGAWVQFMIHDW